MHNLKCLYWYWKLGTASECKHSLSDLWCVNNNATVVSLICWINVLYVNIKHFLYDFWYKLKRLCNTKTITVSNLLQIQKSTQAWNRSTAAAYVLKVAVTSPVCGVKVSKDTGMWLFCVVSHGCNKGGFIRLLLVLRGNVVESKWEDKGHIYFL